MPLIVLQKYSHQHKPAYNLHYLAESGLNSLHYNEVAIAIRLILLDRFKRISGKLGLEL